MPKDGRRHAARSPAALQYQLLKRWGLRATVFLSALVGLAFLAEQAWG